MYAEHLPTEFERDRHYLYDSSGTDIEPIAQESAGGDHGHSHDHAAETCACAAGEADHPFTMDCTDTAAIAAAEAKLNDASSCVASKASCEAVVGGEMPCQIAFFVLQAHHDYCEHNTLTSAREHRLVHDYEEFCLQCAVTRPFDSNIADCNIPTCEDSAPALAAVATLAAGCTVGGACCGTTALQDAFKVL